MGFDPNTMVEHGILWAEHQDPYGHVMQSQFMQFAGACFFRVMESYDQWLSQKEYDDLLHARGIMMVIKKYHLDLKRPVVYPDVVRWKSLPQSSLSRSLAINS